MRIHNGYKRNRCKHGRPANRFIGPFECVFVASLVLSGCALPEGAVLVNAEISRAVHAQQTEVEKVIDWALQPYYDRLLAAKQTVLVNAIELEKIPAWRIREIGLVWAEMKDGTILGAEGANRIEALKLENPTTEQLTTVQLPAVKLAIVSAAVEARYEIAKDEMDEEKKRIISQLRQNSNNIASANDKLTQALEQHRKNAVQTTKVAKSLLTVVAPILPGMEKVITLVEQFEQSAELTGSAE